MAIVLAPVIFAGEPLSQSRSPCNSCADSIRPQRADCCTGS